MWCCLRLHRQSCRRACRTGAWSVFGLRGGPASGGRARGTATSGCGPSWPAGISTRLSRWGSTWSRSRASAKWTSGRNAAAGSWSRASPGSRNADTSAPATADLPSSSGASTASDIRQTHPSLRPRSSWPRTCSTPPLRDRKRDQVPSHIRAQRWPFRFRRR